MPSKCSREQGLAIEAYTLLKLAVMYREIRIGTASRQASLFAGVLRDVLLADFISPKTMSDGGSMSSK
jgi:hypothetical protein